MRLTILHGVAINRGATSTARAIAAELERRGLPCTTDGSLTLVSSYHSPDGCGRIVS